MDDIRKQILRRKVKTNAIAIPVSILSTAFYFAVTRNMPIYDVLSSLLSNLFMNAKNTEQAADDFLPKKTTNNNLEQSLRDTFKTSKIKKIGKGVAYFVGASGLSAALVIITYDQLRDDKASLDLSVALAVCQYFGCMALNLYFLNGLIKHDFKLMRQSLRQAGSFLYGKKQRAILSQRQKFIEKFETLINALEYSSSDRRAWLGDSQQEAMPSDVLHTLLTIVDQQRTATPSTGFLANVKSTGFWCARKLTRNVLPLAAGAVTAYGGLVYGCATEESAQDQLGMAASIWTTIFSGLVNSAVFYVGFQAGSTIANVLCDTVASLYKYGRLPAIYSLGSKSIRAFAYTLPVLALIIASRSGVASEALDKSCRDPKVKFGLIDVMSPLFFNYNNAIVNFFFMYSGLELCRQGYIKIFGSEAESIYLRLRDEAQKILSTLKICSDEEFQARLNQLPPNVKNHPEFEEFFKETESNALLKQSI